MFHFSARVYSRSFGHSSVASSAYFSRSSLYDGRRGVIYDYSYKSDLSASFILSPAGAPDWVSDRERLWNEVERLEKRTDSQLFRGITVAFPRAFSDEVAEQVLLKFVSSQFVDVGMIVDANVHGVGGINPHAHLMIPMRSISTDGFGLKERSWNAPGNVTQWRQAWADICNKELDDMGLGNFHISPLSNQVRGINKPPQRHAGYVGMKNLEEGEIDYHNAQIAIDRLRLELEEIQKEIDSVLAARRKRSIFYKAPSRQSMVNTLSATRSTDLHIHRESPVSEKTPLPPQPDASKNIAVRVADGGLAGRLRKIDQQLTPSAPSGTHGPAP